MKEGNSLRNETFFLSTLILIIVNFFLRFLGFFYRILLSRYLGSEGIGLFHLSFHVFLISITITTSGIPVAVSKIIAQKKSLKEYSGCNKTLRMSIFIGLLLSVIIMILIYINIEYIVQDIIKNNRLYYCILVLIPGIPIVTLSSILRSYYYGIKNVKPAAKSQIIEQLTRIIFVIGILYYTYPLELITSVTIATIGISFGEFCGLYFLISKLKLEQPIISTRRITKALKLKENIEILKKIFIIAIPITLSRLVAVLIQSANMFLVPQRLQIAGYSLNESVGIFGEVVGMTMPLLFLPFIVTSAFVVNIIPNISEEIAHQNWNQIKSKSLLSLRITLLVSIPISLLYIFFGDAICMFLYDRPTVGLYLRYLSITSVFLSVHHILSAILHGMGKQVITTINYLIGMSLHLICIYFLVSNPSIAIYGFLVGFILSSLIILCLNYISFKKYIYIKINVLNHIFKPLISSILMVFMIKFCYLNIFNNFPPKINMLFSLLLGGLVYLLIILASRCIELSTIKYLIKTKK